MHYALCVLHTTREKHENIIKRSTLYFYTNPTRKRSFSKTLFKPEEIILKILKTELLRSPCDFSARLFFKRRFKMNGDCCVFKFLWRSIEENHLKRFQSEISVFQFLGHSVELFYQCILWIIQMVKFFNEVVFRI